MGILLVGSGDPIWHLFIDLRVSEVISLGWVLRREHQIRKLSTQSDDKLPTNYKKKDMSACKPWSMDRLGYYRFIAILWTWHIKQNISTAIQNSRPNDPGFKLNVTACDSLGYVLARNIDKIDADSSPQKSIFFQTRSTENGKELLPSFPVKKNTRNYLKPN